MPADLAVSADGGGKFPIWQRRKLSLPHCKRLFYFGLPQTADPKKQSDPGFEKHLIFLSNPPQSSVDRVGQTPIDRAMRWLVEDERGRGQIRLSASTP